MACPFFSPTEPAQDIALPHPGRLPLGSAWRGTCGAPGAEAAQPGVRELESCNLGYAHACPRLPAQRSADAVRFVVSKYSVDRVRLRFVLEAEHLPVEHGSLEYDRTLSRWTLSHSNPGIQKLAECFLQSYLERRES